MLQHLKIDNFLGTTIFSTLLFSTFFWRHSRPPGRKSTNEKTRNFSAREREKKAICLFLKFLGIFFFLQKKVQFKVNLWKLSKQWRAPQNLFFVYITHLSLSLWIMHFPCVQHLCRAIKKLRMTSTQYYIIKLMHICLLALERKVSGCNSKIRTTWRKKKEKES